jgi:hypothetical protein
MIVVEPPRDKSILIITPRGSLEKADFETIVPRSNGKLNGLMINIESFPGWKNFEALAAHLRFVSGHHRRIERIAVVTGPRLFRIIPAIAGLFVHPEVRLFDLKQRAPALSSLEAGRL